MNNRILPHPTNGTGTDTPTPTPAQIETALSVIGAEQVAPGVWTATLSIGVTIRITDPTPPREVWVVIDGMGGYVCGESMPDMPDGICGMPTESEPCSIHSAVSDAD